MSTRSGLGYSAHDRADSFRRLTALPHPVSLRVAQVFYDQFLLWLRDTNRILGKRSATSTKQ